MSRCALVSTSGELLASRHGAAIDAHRLVMRIGQAPVSSALRVHIGRRTSIRYIAGSFFAGWRKNNATMLHDILRELSVESSEVVIVVTTPYDAHGWREAVGCPQHISSFMSAHSGLAFRCLALHPLPSVNRDFHACVWPTNVQLSSGAVAISLLFGVFGCASVSLFGFANENASMPYHYWRDGSIHDGATAAEWYAKRKERALHDFDKEHWIMHSVLGDCSWTLRAERYHKLCQRSGSARTGLVDAAKRTCCETVWQYNSSRQWTRAAKPCRTTAADSGYSTNNTLVSFRY